MKLEVYNDSGYYGMFAVREVSMRKLSQSLHFKDIDTANHAKQVIEEIINKTISECIDVVKKYEDELYLEIIGTAPIHAKYTPLMQQLKIRIKALEVE